MLSYKEDEIIDRPTQNKLNNIQCSIFTNLTNIVYYLKWLDLYI